jgi:hypothetical protein
MTATVIHVRAHEVEHGDLLFGRTWRPVDSILLDCSDGQEWCYGDEHGRTIARCKVWASVQVIRDLPGEVEAQSLAHPCPAVPVGEVAGPSPAISPADEIVGAESASREAARTPRGSGVSAPTFIEPDPASPHGITRSHGLLTVVQ